MWDTIVLSRVSLNMKKNDKSLAYALLRIAFGINFAGHGLIRIYNGAGTFATTTAEHLAKSPLPHSLTFGFSYAIPFIEAILGLVLILGIFTRAALVCGAAFMMALTIGVASNQQWDIAGQQLLYSVVFFLLLYLIEHNALSVDTYLHHSSIQ
jgi:thiosulfate dehydrogenase [quinone] large subunit